MWTHWYTDGLLPHSMMYDVGDLTRPYRAVLWDMFGSVIPATDMLISLGGVIRDRMPMYTSFVVVIGWSQKHKEPVGLPHC